MPEEIGKIVAALIDEKSKVFEEYPGDYSRFYKFPKQICRKKLDFSFENFTDSLVVASDGEE